MIGRVQAVVLWIYDFLAEDPILVIGMVIAVVVTILASHITKLGAGFILWGVVLAVLVASLARAAAARS